MKLSETQFAEFVLWFCPRQLAETSPRPTSAMWNGSTPGRPVLSVPKPLLTPLMARARILPRAGAKRRAVSHVAVRSVGPAGIVLVDNGYWLDGEQFLLLLPERPGVHRPARGILCTVTRWSPLNSEQFIISASFDRLVGAFERSIQPNVEKTTGT